MTAIPSPSQTTAQPAEIREFSFPRGLAGFPDASRFAFIYEGKGHMLCMQSLEHEEASFIVTPWDTSRLGEPPELSKEQRTCLKLSADDQVMWMLVLNPFADKTWVTANLKAPIAINENQLMGLQCILNNTNLELRHPWMKQPNP
ncbi:MAG: flagellar assembly protein FliW [Ghiorsea sp.]|nr:flagellar assembly protein FliW [Ghiorsea sp.]